MTTGVVEAKRERFYARPWFRPALGILLLVAIITTGPIYGWATSGGKISPEIPRDAEVVSVIVDLNVDVSTFHRTELAKLGVFSGRDRNNPTDRSRVRLQNVTQGDLDKLSRFYWVVAIEPA